MSPAVLALAFTRLTALRLIPEILVMEELLFPGSEDEL